MSSHPSDAMMATLIRHARTTAAHTPPPMRTRGLGEPSLRQCSAGRLVVEAAHCDAGVSDSIGQARREAVASELERRRMTDAAEAARAHAVEDRDRAERERQAAWAQTRRHDGPAPSFATLAIVAATTASISEHKLATVIDAAVENEPGLSPADSAELTGEPRVGLSPSQVAEELAAAGASAAAINGLPHTAADDISPATLIGRSFESAAVESSSPAAAVAVETSPQVG